MNYESFCFKSLVTVSPQKDTIMKRSDIKNGVNLCFGLFNSKKKTTKRKDTTTSGLTANIDSRFVVGCDYNMKDTLDRVVKLDSKSSVFLMNSCGQIIPVYSRAQLFDNLNLTEDHMMYFQKNTNSSSEYYNTVMLRSNKCMPTICESIAFCECNDPIITDSNTYSIKRQVDPIDLIQNKLKPLMIKNINIANIHYSHVMFVVMSAIIMFLLIIGSRKMISFLPKKDQKNLESNEELRV